MEQLTEQWNQLQRPVKFLIVVLIWGFMGGGYYSLFYQDQFKAYQFEVRKFKQARKKRDELQTIQFNIERWKSRIAQLDGELERAKLLLPTKKYLPKLLRRIDELARKSGLEIVKFNPRRNPKRGFYSEVPVQISVNGTFYEVMMFMNKVSNLQRIVTMDTLELGRPSFKNQKMMLNANFRLVTYRYHGTQKKKKKRKRRR